MESNDWSARSFTDCRTTLRKWREDNVRRSEECVEIWEHVLSRKPPALGDEIWMVYEQVCIAALDCSRLDIAQECLQALRGQFPDSFRVLKLEAMLLETIGKFDEALKLYESLSKKDETNPSYHKRKVAIYKAQGRITDAIKDLSHYLETFLNDNEAWMELCSLYLSEMDYARAAHCMEEVLLSNPNNHLYHQRLGEIKYSQGGLDNIEIAKHYFSEAVKLNSSNLRAQFGLLMSCYHLIFTGKSSGQKRKDLTKLAQYAAEKIMDCYDEEDPDNPTIPKAVEAMINALNSQLNDTKLA